MRSPIMSAGTGGTAFGRWSGLTLIELLIVIGIAGFLATMASPFMFSSVGRNRLSTASAEGVDALREAQFSVMSGYAPARYGVHFEAGKFVYFRGTTYAPADTNNVEHVLTDNVVITSVVLTPGGACTVATGVGNCDVHFASGDGSPVESGSVVFRGPDLTTQTVVLNAVGMVDVN
jgi:prepilin-type N-terminal cleavage/methylation domain-containing protein